MIKIKTMRISKHIMVLILLIGTTLLYTTSCKHDHEHNDQGEHNHNNEHAHEDENLKGGQAEHNDHEKTVLLNEAQYKNAEIDTGWFLMKNLSDVVYANGYTKLDPEDEADVNMPISGTIKTVKVIEGDYVKKGQTLATMVSLDYNKMLLERAKIQKEIASSESNLVYLQQEYDRQETLAQESINAQKIFQKISADLQTEKSKISADKEQLEIMNATLSMINNSNSSTINITAPISGYITDLSVKVGSITIPGSPLFSIVDNSQMHVDLLVYEKDLNKVKVGQVVRFILTNQSNQEIKGEIYNIGKSFANETKSVAVHADIETNDANLIPGMYINALIDIGNKQVKALPESAIVNAEGRNFIFLMEEKISEHSEQEEHDDHDEISFSRLEVKTGAKQLGFVEVIPLGDIHDGDKVVMDGAYYLQSHLQKAESGGGHSH